MLTWIPGKRWSNTFYTKNRRIFVKTVDTIIYTFCNCCFHITTTNHSKNLNKVNETHVLDPVWWAYQKVEFSETSTSERRKNPEKQCVIVPDPGQYLISVASNSIAFILGCLQRMNSTHCKCTTHRKSASKNGKDWMLNLSYSFVLWMVLLATWYWWQSISNIYGAKKVTFRFSIQKN